MKTLLITQLFRKTSRKHSHKKRKVYCVIDMLWISKLNAQGAFVIIFFICNDLCIASEAFALYQ